MSIDGCLKVRRPKLECYLQRLAKYSNLSQHLIFSSAKGSEGQRPQEWPSHEDQQGGEVPHSQQLGQAGGWGPFPEHLTETFISFLPGGPHVGTHSAGHLPSWKVLREGGSGAEDSVPLLSASRHTAVLPSCWRDFSANPADAGGWSQSPVSQTEQGREGEEA